MMKDSNPQIKDIKRISSNIYIRRNLLNTSSLNYKTQKRRENQGVSIKERQIEYEYFQRSKNGR